MTNFRIKYASCVSRIARETDLVISRNTQTALSENYELQVLFCLLKIAFLANVMNEQTHKDGQQNLLLKNFIQISVSLC